MWSVSLKWRHSKNQITIKKEKERKRKKERDDYGSQNEKRKQIRLGENLYIKKGGGREKSQRN